MDIDKLIKKNPKIMIKCLSCDELVYGCDQQENCPKEDSKK